MNGTQSEPVTKNAAVIGGITMLARVAGFGRILVLTWAVGIGGLLDVYNTANRVPNILYEIVAGGALSALVVPLLTAPIARRSFAMADRTASALLTWSLIILAPLGVIVAAAARPIMMVLIGDGGGEAQIAMGTRMIQVFSPQLPLYGVGVVLTGILHAHRRFVWPALAPILSSVTVIGAYVAYGVLAGPGSAVGDVAFGHELILSIGTTSATVVMTVCLFIPLRRLGVRWRPRLSFGEEGVAAHVRSMAVAGGISIAAWQVSLLFVLGLTNGGPQGTVGIFMIGLTVYMLPWGVFAMPLAVSSYPALSQAHALGDSAGYDQLLGRTTRHVVVLSALGAAGLWGLANPLGTIFDRVGGTIGADGTIAATIAALSPGLIGFALFPLLTRALYAVSAMRVAATATIVGWGATYVAAIAFSLAVPTNDRALAVAWGNSTGMCVLGVALIIAVARTVGTRALAGVWRAGLVSMIAAAMAAAAGRAGTTMWGTSPSVGEAIVAILVGGTMSVLVFGLVTLILNGNDFRSIAAGVRERMRSKK